MAFGQNAGPPAGRRQLEELLGLVVAAGYDDFREARHPLGLTQRQAGGKFTGAEAQALIDRLVEAAEAGVDPAAPAEPVAAAPARRAGGAGPRPAAGRATADRRRAPSGRSLRTIPAEVLAGELQRRGWAVIEP